MNFNKKIKKIIGLFIALFIVFLIAAIVILLMLKYEVEGENNMPFELTQIITVSTAEGIPTEENAWNFDIVQNNDVYIHIGKNKNYKETEVIKNITIDNFTINDEPEKGKIILYKPSESEDKTFEYDEKYEIDMVSGSIVFNGEESTNLKTLSIANQGGVIAFRYSIQDLAKYKTEEIKHDGTLLSKIGVTYEDIKCNVSFDITIELIDGTKFTGNVTLDIPSGDIVKNGISNSEKNDFSDVVFKRN